MIKNNLSTCYNCERTIPKRLLAEFFTDNNITEEPEEICGVCALEMSNDYLGIDRKKFDGKQAESNRLEAIKYYKKTNQMK